MVKRWVRAFYWTSLMFFYLTWIAALVAADLFGFAFLVAVIVYACAGKLMSRHDAWSET